MNRELGLAGELLVLEHEKHELIRNGRSDLADLVVHVAVSEGDNAGYDIRSFCPDEQVKFIEVKTTRGDASTELFATSNELAFSQRYAKSYFLYRLYDFNEGSAQCFITKGPLDESYTLTPTQYRLRIS